MKSIATFFALAAIIGAVVAGTNYCDKSFCVDDPQSDKHIACGHNGKFVSTCPKDAVMVKIDSKLQKLVLDEFNKRRNIIAGAGVKKFRPACRMGTMRWNDELAKLAEFNVKGCDFEHDCHETKAFMLSGQNLYQGTYKGDAENLKEGIETWYEELEFIDAAGMKKYPEDVPLEKENGHFFAMMLENNDQVGCAASVFTPKGEKSKELLLACNFSSGFYDGTTAYYACDKPASECKSKKNKDYPNLCSTAEKYQYNELNWPNKKK